MSVQSVTPPVVVSGAESIEQRFARLAAQWHKETWHLSSATRMAEHPAYQEIISLGEAVVPLLLRELAREPDHWFSALKAITGATRGLGRPWSHRQDGGRLARLGEVALNWK